MLGKLFLIAVLIGSPGGLAASVFASSSARGAAGTFATTETRLPLEKVTERLHQEWLQVAEGLVTDVNIETETVRVETDGGQMDFRYDPQTDIENRDQAVIGCLEEQYERRARIYFRTVNGRRMAVRIELLVSRTEMSSD
jgi:hypothetical protein